jgi:hypothetical protein
MIRVTFRTASPDDHNTWLCTEAFASTREIRSNPGSLGNSLTALSLMYLWASLLVVFLSFFPVAWSLKRLRSSQFFPGPASLPIVGNLFQVPSKQPWLTYAQWGKRWGSLIHLEVFKKHILIINDVDDVVELLNNRSRNTSDRSVIRFRQRH